MSANWDTFFGAVTGASVTVFSVVFVVFQVKSAHWRSSPLKTMAAIASLTEFMVPLLASLIMLMPGNPWRIAAWAVGGLGVVAVLTHWTTFWRFRPLADQFDRGHARGAVISFALYTGFLSGGFMQRSTGLYLIGGISVWLLFSGAIQAWWLLEPTQPDKRHLPD